MPEQTQPPEGYPDVPRLRYWGDRKPPKNRAEMFSTTVRNATEGAPGGTTGAGGSGNVATLRMYGPIDSWGGFWGISAKDVSTALDSLGSDVTEIRVRINSPGGDAFEGLTILNMLRAHPAKFVAVVDGLAASAASFIAAAAEETVMSPGTQMMIHDAAGLAYGPAAVMRKTAQFLDSISNSLAAVYSEAAGGSVSDWRAVMVEETWYTAQEAVKAGLADKVGVVADAGATATPGETEDPATTEGDAGVENRFDLSIFNYAGRSHAPAPKPPAASASGSTEKPEGSPAVAFSDEQLTSMRQQLGIATDADEATILAALGEALAERAEPSTAPPATPAAPAAPAPVAASATSAPDGAVVIDSATLELLQAQARKGEQAFAAMQADERDRTIDAAVKDGKIARSRVDHWRNAWKADPEGSKAALASMPKNLVPMEPAGHAGDVDGISEEFASLFPPKEG